MASMPTQMVVEVHSFDVDDHFREFKEMGEQMAAKCRELLGKTVTLKRRQDESYAVTALYFRVEPTGFHQEVELSWFDGDVVQRMAVDECMLNVDKSLEEIEPHDIIGEESTDPSEITPSINETIVLTEKGLLATGANPLDVLSIAVTEHVRLGRRISHLAKTALPVGTRVSHRSFNEGTVVDHTESDDGMVVVQFEDASITTDRLHIDVKDLSAKGFYIDQNYIPF